MTRLRKAAACLLTIQLLLGALAPPPAAARPEAMYEDETTQDEVAPAEPTGLRFRLSEGAEDAGPRTASTPAPADKLSEAETQKVLQRLPPMKAGDGDRQEFALRDKSLPPPRAGATVLAAFPAAEQRPAPDATTAGQPEVVRFAPEGEVPLAPQLSVTFSRPMVAVTSQDEAAREVPVTLTPQVPGRWRWLGTKTLIFDPAGERLPMATEFRATVTAGAPRTWTFATPPPKVLRKYPDGTVERRDALMFVEFDQRIDPAAVLRTVSARGGGAPLRLRLATEAEVKAHPLVGAFAKQAVEGRWLAFRAEGPGGDTRLALPGDAPVVVNVGPGTPSAEGPRTTREPQTFSFRTYGPLRLTGHACGYEKRCSPYDSFQLSFSNPLDAAAFDKSQVTIEPALPGATIVVYGNDLHVEGLKRGRTTYRVTVAGTLRDQFGQTLERPQSVAFQVGSADPSLASGGHWFFVKDPASDPDFRVYTINHASLRVSLYAVAPEDWPAYTEHIRAVHQYYDEKQRRKAETPPGRLVSTKVVPVKHQPDEAVETRIPLAPALRNGKGHVVVVVEPAQKTGLRRRRRNPDEGVRSWVQVTDIGLDAFADNQQLVAWATTLQDGRPVAGAEVTMLPWGTKAATGPDGVARFQLSENAPNEGAVLVARVGDQTAMLPEQHNWWNGGSGWVRRAPADALAWYVFDDRRMYRPGEEVNVKGWVRRRGGGVRGDVGPLAGAAEMVAYTAQDSRGNEIARGSVALNALGGFHVAFKLPATPNLGHARLQFQAQGGEEALAGRQHQHTFQVQEFRRPEFEVSAKASEGPHFVGAHATATVSATYYAGGGLPDSEVNWNVTAAPATFTPPNRDDFTFGRWVPWWESSPYGGRPGGATTTQSFRGRTDASGRHHLRLDFDSVRPPQASTVTAQASVIDVNRQAWTTTTTMLVHPADLYVGLRSPRTFVQQGEPLVVEAIVTDLDGKLVTGRQVRARAVLLDWVFEKGVWKQVEADAQECDVRSGGEPVRCTFRPKQGGTYRVRATVLDDRERPNETELTLWVAGGKRPTQKNLEQERAELIPDRKEYRAGETAEVLVQSPFAPAEGVVTLRRSGLLRTERFRMDGPSHTLRIPVEEAFTPNLHLQVDLVGAAPRVGEDGLPDEKLPKRPAFAKGELNLSVPPLARRLQVSAVPRDKALEPGGETTVSVEVKDAGGRGVEGSELAVVVVDEAILALTGYKLDDPLSVFYTPRGADVTDHYLRSGLLLEDPQELAEKLKSGTTVGVGAGGGVSAPVAAAPPPPPAQKTAALMRSRPGMAREEATVANAMVGEGMDAAAGEGIRLRENFNALVVFAPAVKTDSAGRAEVKVKVPDSLTRYRVMAVSVAGGKQFGSGESSITARMPLMVRPSAPRFMNFGDRVELPVIVQNQTDEEAEVRVVVRASNAALTDGAGRRVRVPANDRVEVRFPVAADAAGTARFQFGAVWGRHADAAQIELPVWTPATTEAFATYGELDASGALVQPVKAPPNVFPQFGGLEVQTSSTQLQALTDAVLYLASYPYECSEQLSSRVLAVAALKDVLGAFKAEGLPAPEELKRAVARDIERLRGMQNEDGGFGFWRRGERSWPYVSIHVAHALARAKEKGFDVPPQMLERARAYLREVESHLPKSYNAEARRAIIAYALNVRARMGDRDAARARQLLASAGGLGTLSLEAVGWLLPVLSGDAKSAAEVEAIRRHLNNRAEETAGAAHFTTNYGDDGYLLLHSSRRADGVILEALIGDQPQSDLIPKIVRGLLAHRKKGRWENTQENVFILLALDRYFNTYEKTTPDFVARAWLGEAYAGEQQFRGRSTDRREFQVPMRYLAEQGGTPNLTLSKEGAGRLYYRIGMQYAPSNLKLAAADYGFTVERVYEGMEDPADVRREADGTWRIRSGSKVRVRLTLAAPTRRYHVALTDPLPAGLEALNPALAVTESLPPEERGGMNRHGWWWSRPWYEHQNLRDERAEAFTSLLWEGVYTYTYYARATTPGAFVVPPPKAEEMYSPETFGRGASDRVVVE